MLSPIGKILRGTHGWQGGIHHLASPAKGLKELGTSLPWKKRWENVTATLGDRGYKDLVTFAVPSALAGYGTYRAIT